MKDYKWYGHFNADDSFTVTEPETPRHWYNYMFNDEYVTFTSQVGYGEGLAQDDMGRRILLVSNRNIFVSENGEAWSLFGLPLDYGYTDYSCLHGCGFSTVSLSYNGIKSAVAHLRPKRGQTGDLERDAYQYERSSPHCQAYHLCENRAGRNLPSAGLQSRHGRLHGGQKCGVRA